MGITRATHLFALACAAIVQVGPDLHGQSLREPVETSGNRPELRSAYDFRPPSKERDRSPHVSANPARGLRSAVSVRGLRVVPFRRVAEGDEPSWELRLRTTHFGREGSQRALAYGALLAEANRVELDLGPLLEWFVNDARGIEQGWTIPAPPAGSREDALWIGLELAGLSARIDGTARSALLVDDSGVLRLRYLGLAAFDADGRELEARFASSSLGLGIRIEDRGARYPVRVDPLLTGPAWTAEGDQAGAQLGHSVSSAGDVNRDGFSDVIVGSPFYDNGEEEEGRAALYLGSASGLSTSPAWSAEGDRASLPFGAQFGACVAGAGDVNGDGYSDVIVGAPPYDNGLGEAGRVLVFLGSTSGLAATPAWTVDSDHPGASFGFAVATAGDVNGDGFSDVIVGSPFYDNGEADEGIAQVYLGSSSGLASAPDWRVEGDQLGSALGSSVAAAGDVNGDGYDDVIVGAPIYSGGEPAEGAAFVFLGSAAGLSTTPAWSAEGQQALASLGTSVSGAGDVNGDGYSDLVLGAPFFNGAHGKAGRALVYLGGPSGPATTPVWTVEGDQANAQFGSSVSLAGDVSGDGFSDVIVGARTRDGSLADVGRTSVYLGSASGPSAIPEWTADGDQLRAQFGASVSLAGDVNGDGFSDVIVGAPFFDNGQLDEGRALVFLGAATGPTTTASWSAEADQANARLGRSVASAGDVNGDGFSDVIVGASFFDNGESNEGRALVYLGSASGLSSAPDWSAEGNQAGAEFGFSVSGAGDVNGDGYDDVIVGARGHDNGEADEGRAYLYRGSASGLSHNPVWILEGNQFSARLGWSVHGAGDINGDGFSDVIVGVPRQDNGQDDEGRAYLFLGSRTGLSVTSDWITEGNQDGAFLGESVSGAGDVDGDGFGDLIVGAHRYDCGESDEGRALLFLGSGSGPSQTPAWTFESNQAGSELGQSLACAGDVNGDGLSDVLVGVHQYTSGQLFEGRALLFLGSAANGLEALPAWSAESNQPNAAFGDSVAGAGDVDGDGYDDVIVGAPLLDNGQIDEGRAYLYLGSASGPSTSPGWRVEGDQTSSQLGNSVASAGDVDGDGFGDVIVGALLRDNGQSSEGQAFLYLGNGGRGGWLRGIGQRRFGGAAPIALLGRSNSRFGFQIRSSFEGSLLGFSQGTPFLPLVWLEWEVEQSKVGTFDGLGLQSSLPRIANGFPLTFDEPVTGLAGLEPGTRYRWRARFHTNNPLLPVTPWFSLPGNGRSQTKLHTKGTSPQPAPGVSGEVDRDV